MRGAIWIGVVIGVVLTVVRERRRIRCALGFHESVFTSLPGWIGTRCIECGRRSSGITARVQDEAVTR